MRSGPGGSSEIAESSPAVSEGFDPNARVEVLGVSQVGEVDAGRSDITEGPDTLETEVPDALETAEVGSIPSEADAPNSEGRGYEGRSLLDTLFSRLEELLDKVRGECEGESWDWVDYLYTNPEQRIAFAKCTDAEPCGDDNYFTMKPNLETSDGQAAYNRMRAFGISEIRYVKGVVDFAPCSVAQTTIDGMTSEITNNKRLGFEAFAEQFNKDRPLENGERWTPRSVESWARENGLEFHECSDMRTIQLVPKEMHRFFRHYGGRAECRIRDGERTERNGEFDE